MTQLNTHPDFSSWLKLDPYTLGHTIKGRMLTDAMVQLTLWHWNRCEPYRRIMELQRIDINSIKQLEDIPFIPVNLFKELDLLSINTHSIFKTMTSSGTSGQKLSRIFLDRSTAAMQSKVLSRLIVDLLGKKRLPMLVIDSPNALKDRQAFSARGAGILGFSMFGQDVTYALDANMNLDEQGIDTFISRHAGSPIFVFGFTFMIWQYFVQPMLLKKIKFSLNMGILMHGGGWKKIQDQSVTSSLFRSAIHECCGIKRIVNYYGMVEQTGSLFLECQAGHLHAPAYADVIVRDPRNFDVAPFGSKGIIEVMSILPGSYPGHALLTEDEGVLLGEDDCSCGRLGKYFSVLGRLPQAEIRGCSDTHEVNL